MPGRKSRDKGARRELEAAALLDATKISGMYQEGPDLMYGERFIEVKAKKDGWKMLHRWLADDASILMLKTDREPWLICMPIETFLDLQEEAKAAANRSPQQYG